MPVWTGVGLRLQNKERLIMFGRAKNCRFGLAGCVMAVSWQLASVEVNAQGPSPSAQRRSTERPSASPEWPVERLNLEVGEQRVLPSEGVQSYSEGVRGVVDVRLTRDAKQFVIVAQRPGQTSLLLIMIDNREKHLSIVVGGGDTKAEPKAGAVPRQDNIRLDFFFVQVDKSYNHQIGVGWPGTVGPASLSAEFDLTRRGFTGASAVVADQALPRLDMAQSQGWAKVVRRAAIITENGKKSTFRGGGEVNVQVSGQLSSGIHQIEFGTTIDVLPRYDAQTGRLQIELQADVSDLADDRGTGVPGRSHTELSSVVNLRLGQSVVLAGLSAQSESSNQSGLPWLSQIPLVGALFGTHTRFERDTRSLVFIVPSVMDTVSAVSRAQIAEALKDYEAYDGDLAELGAMRADLVPLPPVAPAPPSKTGQR
ncbi:MAG: pilus assembly protein N-terminal domain-containing protein [Polyangiaceae bacterium]|nr:pilus assembly protein N-terminal domain-containing protein [Polyangiaceae bacterium]